MEALLKIGDHWKYVGLFILILDIFWFRFFWDISAHSTWQTRLNSNMNDNSIWPIPRWSSQTCQVVLSPGRCQWPVYTCDRPGNAGTFCWQFPQDEDQCFFSPRPLVVQHSPPVAWCNGQCIWLNVGIKGDEFKGSVSLLISDQHPISYTSYWFA